MGATSGLVVDPIRAAGKGLVLFVCQWTISGSSGAVSNVRATAFGASAVGTVRGSVVRDSLGQYTVTLPGRGSSLFIAPVSAVAADGTTGLRGVFESVSLSARSLQVQFLDTADAADDPADTTVCTVVCLASDHPHI